MKKRRSHHVHRLVLNRPLLAGKRPMTQAEKAVLMKSRDLANNIVRFLANQWLAVVFLVVITPTASLLHAATAERPPNFVIIFTDDQGYADLGCFGSPDIRTPCLDAMAQQGMKFTSFYAQPICGPSRAAIMTGCYPLRVAEHESEEPDTHSRSRFTETVKG